MFNIIALFLSMVVTHSNSLLDETIAKYHHHTLYIDITTGDSVQTFRLWDWITISTCPPALPAADYIKVVHCTCQT